MHSPSSQLISGWSAAIFVFWSYRRSRDVFLRSPGLYDPLVYCYIDSCCLLSVYWNLFLPFQKRRISCKICSGAESSSSGSALKIIHRCWGLPFFLLRTPHWFLLLLESFSLEGPNCAATFVRSPHFSVYLWPCICWYSCVNLKKKKELQGEKIFILQCNWHNTSQNCQGWGQRTVETRMPIHKRTLNWFPFVSNNHMIYNDWLHEEACIYIPWFNTNYILWWDEMAERRVAQVNKNELCM